MKKGALLFSVVPLSLVLLLSSFAVAAEPKVLVDEIFETKEVIERSVRTGKWVEADSGVITLVVQMKELVATLNISDAGK